MQVAPSGYQQVPQQMGYNAAVYPQGGYQQAPQQMGMMPNNNAVYPQGAIPQQMAPGNAVYPMPNMGTQVQGRQTYNPPNTSVIPVVIQGFETCGPCVPVSYYVQPPQVIQMDFSSLSKTAVVPVDTAKMLLERWVSQQCCYGSNSAKTAQITCEGVCNSLAIQMDTFVETRTSHQKEVPYHRNEPVAFPQGAGIPPRPWDMQLPQQQFFADSVTHHEVPFTSVVQRDHVCGGDGRVRCDPCGGDGKVRCGHCNGDGRVSRSREDGTNEQVPCGSCGGDGQRQCGKCNGHGHVECHHCKGTGFMRHFIEIVRTHKTINTYEVLDQISDAELPPALIKQAGGFSMASSQYQNIQPPQGIAPDLDASLLRVKESATRSVVAAQGYQLQEKLNIKVVPVSKFKATVGGQPPFIFFIYGTDSLVHCNNYPETCCWGCSIA